MTDIQSYRTTKPYPYDEDPLYDYKNSYQYAPNCYSKHCTKLMYMIINIASYSIEDIEKYIDQLENNEEINFVNKKKWSALMIACRNFKDIKLIELLLKNGAKINYNINGYSALCAAIANSNEDDNIEVVKFLLNHNAQVNNETQINNDSDSDVDIDSDNNTTEIDDNINALELAVHSNKTNKNNLGIAKLLIEKGAFVDPVLNHITTPLIIAVKCTKYAGHDKMVKLLLNGCANIDQQDYFGNTALIAAALNSNSTSNISTVRLLLEHNADTEIADMHGYTPLLMAIAHCDHTSSYETVELLLEKGAKVNRYNKRADFGPMLICGRPLNQTTLTTLKLLLNNGAQVNTCNLDSETALFLAVQQQNRKQITNEISKLFTEAIELLIETGANVNAQDRKGRTPLMIAIKGYKNNNSSALEVIELLLDQADLTITDKRKRNVLDYAKVNEQLPKETLNKLKNEMRYYQSKGCIIC